MDELNKEKEKLHLNEFEVALIKTGIIRLAYDPCKLSLIHQDFTCSQIYAYLVFSAEILKLPCGDLKS
jgi:hypothetical protein